MKKVKVLIPLTFIAFSINAQISGKLLTDNNRALPQAYIWLEKANKGVITDAEGNFKINANKGDTIIIQHIEVGVKKKVLEGNNLTIRLSSKNNVIGEITVSGNYAFKILKKSRQKTYKRLRNDYKAKAFWRGIEIIEGDTAQLVDMDLIVEQKKLKKLGRGARIKVSKLQERIEQGARKNPFGNKMDFEGKVEPFENNFLIYKDFKDEYVYRLKEDNQYIFLYFFPIKKIEKGYNNIELCIRKNDFTIKYIASATARNKQKYSTQKKTFKGNKKKNNYVNLLIKYNHNKSYSYLSEFYYSKNFDIINKKDSVLKFTHTSHYKVYNADFNEKIKKKTNRVYNFNILKDSNNRFQTRFWNHHFFKNTKINYDFEKLKTLND
ncbi:MAG: carboxypeptidase-like regulatory domain-containing protein [Bacteroidota bacterium]